MSILSIENLEKHEKDLIIFTAFNLHMTSGEVAAIHSNTNVRDTLVDIFEGKVSSSSGLAVINGNTYDHDRKRYFRDIGICSLKEGMYERLRVQDHLMFHKKLFSSSISIDAAAKIVQLTTKMGERVGKLTMSEKKRLQFARLLFQNPEFFLFEEPHQNVDLETHRIFNNLVQLLSSQGKAVLILTGNIENALSVTDQVYRLGETGLRKFDVKPVEEEAEISPEQNRNTNEMSQNHIEEALVQPVRFEKIPAKVNEKIILFNPTEIDYIESDEGVSNLFINSGKYPSVFTMNELEERLLPYGFFRCHRSYLVNLQKVREVITWTRNSYSLVLDNRDKSNIPLSKGKMAELKEMIGLK